MAQPENSTRGTRDLLMPVVGVRQDSDANVVQDADGTEIAEGKYVLLRLDKYGRLRVVLPGGTDSDATVTIVSERSVAESLERTNELLASILNRLNEVK